MDLKSIADELDAGSRGRPIGDLQGLRKELKGHSRRVGGQIFGTQTVFERWAFHLGGRRELQFNIGFEGTGRAEIFRYGVAFSFERSQTLPDVTALVPKVSR